jgi:hypothetical protein
LTPYCQPGYEHGRTDQEFVCLPCLLGFYKKNPSRDMCTVCPVGANCTLQATVSPCIEAGYWQDPRVKNVSDSEVGFEKYEVWSCDDPSACLGSCKDDWLSTGTASPAANPNPTPIYSRPYSRQLNPSFSLDDNVVCLHVILLVTLCFLSRDCKCVHGRLRRELCRRLSRMRGLCRFLLSQWRRDLFEMSHVEICFRIHAVIVHLHTFPDYNNLVLNLKKIVRIVAIVLPIILFVCGVLYWVHK